MLSIKDTPGRIEGFAFSEVFDCNWSKCWSLPTSTFSDETPYLIQLPNGEFWVADQQDCPSRWGTAEAMPPLDTSTFTGPFDNFDLAFSTYVLMVSAYL